MGVGATRTVMAIAALMAVSSTAAVAQVAREVWPNGPSVVDPGRPAQPGVPDQAIAPPAHPPIHFIPPMPMPDINLPAPPGSLVDMVLVHDAETGRTIELPLGDPSGLPGANGGGTFIGAGGEDFGEFDPRTFTPMSLATNTVPLDEWPARGNCKIIMEFTDTTGALRYFSCSGSMQDAGVVLTAGHCVYARTADGPDIFDWANRIWVYPGWDGDGDGSDPATDAVFQHFGNAVGTSFLAGSAWVSDGNWDRDCGLIRLSRTATRHPGILTGWFGWAWGFDCGTIQDRTYYNYSFPAEDCSASLHNGRDMYRWAGTIDNCPDNQLQLYTTAGCFTAVWGGMSGSGMYYFNDSGDRVVHAVCSTSNRTTRGQYCKLWEQFVTDMQDYENGTRGADFDLQALKYRTGGSDTVAAGGQLAAGSLQVSNVSNFNPGERTITVRFYLSTNNNISVSDTLLATYNWNVNFGPVDNIQFNVPALTIPVGTASGDYWVGAIIDDTEDANDNNSDTDTWDAQPINVNPCVLPSTVGGISATDGACAGVTVSWNAVGGASSYRVYRNTSNSSVGRIQIASDSASPYFDASTTSNVTYYYWVRASNACGLSTSYGTANSGWERGVPSNDRCVSAISLSSEGGSLEGNLTCASNDDSASCGASGTNRDVWYRFAAPSAGDLLLTTCGTHDDPGQDLGMDTVLALFSTCGGTELACNDDTTACRNDLGLDRDSRISHHLSSGQTVRVRVSHFSTSIDDGNFILNWSFAADACPADYDGDGFLTGLDFDAFVADFEAGNLDADFDGDGFLTGLDFDAFVQAFEAGC